MLMRLAILVLLLVSAGFAQSTIGPSSTYAQIAERLTPFIEQELADKAIPGLAIALVDDDEIAWARGFGTARYGEEVPATAESIWRVGSVSKLFTDIAIMQLVERGEIDLDAPVSTYVPEFAPANSFAAPITLRHLMSHRSGLVREPPRGNYFDDSDTTLAETAASLAGAPIVYEPGKRTKYSNAGIAVVGYTLEKLKREPFTHYVKHAVLDPLGMKSSAFEPLDEFGDQLATGLMWSYDGREFAAPTFQLGMAPAGSLYTSVNDLGRFIVAMLHRGGGIIEPETLDAMFTPQFEGSTFGIGFSIDDFEGHKRYGHGGAVYGFVTSLYFMPEPGIGVVVVNNCDVASAVNSRIADFALRLMLAKDDLSEVPTPEMTTAIPPGTARRLDGTFTGPRGTVDLVERNGGLFLDIESRRLRLQSSGDGFVTDERLGFGTRVKPSGDDEIQMGDAVYTRQTPSKPAPAPERFLGLIGEYGWDHNVLFIYEKAGRLHALIEWIEIDPMVEINENTYAFPETGSMYHGERIVFERDADSRATRAIVAGIAFPRRAIKGESGETFHITPLKPVDELRTIALNAERPVEEGDFLETDLVELAELDAAIKYDIRYAATDNFMQAKFYDEARAFMQRPAAEAVARAQQKLKAAGYGLLIHDAYRPWYVTKMFWDATPDAQKRFVADPSEGSRHNRGCAVDLTLYDLDTGAPIQMTGGYDEMSERSYPDYLGGTSLQRHHRKLLRDVMEAQGFTVYQFEWWHFDFTGWEHYRIGNDTFDRLRR